MVFGFEAFRGGVSSLVVAVFGALPSVIVRCLSGMPFSISLRLGNLVSGPSWGSVPIVRILVWFLLPILIVELVRCGVRVPGPFVSRVCTMGASLSASSGMALWPSVVVVVSCVRLWSSTLPLPFGGA